jgi:biopolymer transport protein ExbB/TolQ
MFQDAAPDFSLLGLLNNMGWPARIIAFILFVMSIWSLAVMIDRYLYFSAARKQSREFAPKVAGALKDSKLEEAIKIADRSKKSHLAEVVTAGLQEFRSTGAWSTKRPSRAPSALSSGPKPSFMPS